jgi:Tfp pilus assembly major pilin PilA
MVTAAANRKGAGRGRGFTLIEAIVLVTVMSVVAVAAGVGLQAVAKVPTQTDATMGINNALVDAMEQWKAKSWATMASSTGTVTVNGRSYTRTVTVADADPASPEGGGTAKADFRRITVTIGSQTLRSYATKP